MEVGGRRHLCCEMVGPGAAFGAVRQETGRVAAGQQAPGDGGGVGFGWRVEPDSARRWRARRGWRAGVCRRGAPGPAGRSRRGRARARGRSCPGRSRAGGPLPRSRSGRRPRGSRTGAARAGRAAGGRWRPSLSWPWHSPGRVYEVSRAGHGTGACFRRRRARPPGPPRGGSDGASCPRGSWCPGSPGSPAPAPSRPRARRARGRWRRARRVRAGRSGP